MKIALKLLNESATAPKKAHRSDAGFDLYAAESAELGAGERAAIGTGIAVEIPEGFAGLVLPRSGLALKHGIALVNAPGLIDSEYRGEVRVLLLNTDKEGSFLISEGDRIAQLVITPVPEAELETQPELTTTTRGDGGFGSTGAA